MNEFDWTKTKARATCDLRSYDGPQWELSRGDLSGYAYLGSDGAYWFKFPGEVEFPLETVLVSDAFEVVQGEPAKAA